MEICPHRGSSNLCKTRLPPRYALLLLSSSPDVTWHTSFGLQPRDKKRTRELSHNWRRVAEHTGWGVHEQEYGSNAKGRVSDDGGYETSPGESGDKGGSCERVGLLDTESQLACPSPELCSMRHQLFMQCDIERCRIRR